MCGRYTLTSDTLQARFNTANTLEVTPRYNIPPTTSIPIIRPVDGTRQIQEAHWSFPMHFGDKDTLLINARSETLEEKRTFKPHLMHRCLIPASGFYEWQRSPDTKIPHYIHLPAEKLFAFAGLYRETDTGLQALILTINPNRLMRPIHTRMPVILTRETESRWLSDLPYNDVCDTLIPHSAANMAAHPVSRQVNSPRHDSPELLEPFAYDLDA